MTPERLTEEREKYAQARAGVVTQLLSLEQHAALAFLLEDPSDSELWDLPEVKEIIERNQEWVVREIDRCAYGRREQKPTKIPANIPKWVPKGGGERSVQGGNVHRVADARREDRTDTRVRRAQTARRRSSTPGPREKAATRRRRRG